MATPTSNAKNTETHSGSAEINSSATPNTDYLEPKFGWSKYAERINGRFAMIGFVALLAIEFVTQQTFFSWLGLR